MDKILIQDKDIKKYLKGLNIDYGDLEKYIKELHAYKKGFNILMEYFDSIADEEKPKVDARLRKLGL